MLGEVSRCQETNRELTYECILIRKRAINLETWLFPRWYCSNTIQRVHTLLYIVDSNLTFPLYSDPNTWNIAVHSITPRGEMGMYSLKTRYCDPKVVLCDTFFAIALLDNYCSDFFFALCFTTIDIRSVGTLTSLIIINVNATYPHRRPPSVGMPRHALGRLISNVPISALAASSSKGPHQKSHQKMFSEQDWNVIFQIDSCIIV